MSESLLIGAAVSALVDLIVSIVNAKGDADKQNDALMAAEEKLSRIRAKQKFG